MFKRIALLAGALGTALVLTASAHASSGYGTPYQAAVNCDSMSSYVTVTGQADAAPGYSWQYVGVWFYFQNVYSGAWHMSNERLILHQPFVDYGGGYGMTNPHGSVGYSVSLNSGHYKVWTYYRFYDATGSVAGDSGWIQTQAYFNVNSASSATCEVGTWR